MKGGRKRKGKELQLNKQSVNLNREFWAKFNIISKEINFINIWSIETLSDYIAGEY